MKIEVGMIQYSNDFSSEWRLAIMPHIKPFWDRMNSSKLGAIFCANFSDRAALIESALREYLDYPLDWEDFKNNSGREYKLHYIFFNSYLNYFKDHIGSDWVGKVCSLGFSYEDLPSGSYSLLEGGIWIQKCPVNPTKCFKGSLELFERVLVLGGLPYNK